MNRNKGRYPFHSAFVAVPMASFCLAFSVSTAADVDLGPLTNDNNAYSGNITVESPAPGAETGAITVSQPDITTSLTGNIHIISGIDYASGSASTYAHGVIMKGAPGNSLISLVTEGADDRIIIDSYGYTGSGVRMSGTTGEAPGKVLLDATSSTQEYGIVVNLHNTTDGTDKTQEAAGFYIGANVLEAKGNISITTAQARGYGYWVDGTGTIDITGNTNIVTTGHASYGIRGGTPGTATGTGSIIHRGDLSITTSGGVSTGTLAYYGADGIRMQSYSSLTVLGKTTINVSGEGAGGIQAVDNATVTVGEVEITTRGDSKPSLRASALAYGLYSNGSGSITTEKTTIRTYGKDAYGVAAAGTAGTVAVNGNLDIETVNGHGIYSNSSGAKIYLNGATNRIRVGSTANRVLYANNGLIQGTGKYDFAEGAGIYANSGTVDLKMQNNTVFNGYTEKATRGIINLRLEQATKWIVFKDSALTRIDVESGSVLEFNIVDQLDYRNITTDLAIMEAGSIVNIVLNTYNPVLNDIFYLVNSDAYQVSETDIVFNLIGKLDDGLYLYTEDFHINGSVRIVGIPEPVTGSLVLAGLSLMAFRRGRK